MGWGDKPAGSGLTSPCGTEATVFLGLCVSGAARIQVAGSRTSDVYPRGTSVATAAFSTPYWTCTGHLGKG